MLLFSVYGKTLEKRFMSVGQFPFSYSANFNRTLRKQQQIKNAKSSVFPFPTVHIRVGSVR